MVLDENPFGGPWASKGRFCLFVLGDNDIPCLFGSLDRVFAVV